MNRKYIFILVGVLIVLIAVASAGVFTTRNDAARPSSVKPSKTERVSVDFPTDNKVLTDLQESALQVTLLKMTTKEIPKDINHITGQIRESSIQRASDREVSFIVDSPELQTSYLVNRYDSPGDNVDIVYTVCVDQSKKVYTKDYCLVE